MGAVFSHSEGFASLGELWGAMAFHTLAMALGVFSLGKGVTLREVRPATE